MENKDYVTEEQKAYAFWLDWGMKIGMLMLVVSFFIYAFGLLPTHVPVEDISKYWGMPVGEYLKATDGVHGWGWLSRLGKGDYLNFVGIAFLAAVTIVCYAVIIPIFLRKQDRVYAVLAVVEILVLVLAASGVLKSGGH